MGRKRIARKRTARTPSRGSSYELRTKRRTDDESTKLKETVNEAAGSTSKRQRKSEVSKGEKLNSNVKGRKRKRKSSSKNEEDPMKRHVEHPKKKWEFYIPLDEPFPMMHWTSHTELDIVNILKRKLNDRQLRLFRNSCFGYFLDLPPLVVQNQLIRGLMLKELSHEGKNEFYVEVNGCRLRFGIKEFAIVSGLKCCGDDKVASSTVANRLMQKYFPDCARVSKDSFMECFETKEWESSDDDDALKIAILYFIHTFLFSTPRNRAFISKEHFDLVESGAYENFPWGKSVFNESIYNVRDKLRTKATSFRLYGFPLALQIWFYECCYELDDSIATRVGKRVPRILNWTATEKLNLSDINSGILSTTRNKFKFRNMSPTLDELGALNLPEVADYKYEKSVSSSGVRVVLETGDDFETPRPKVKINQPSRKAKAYVCNHEAELKVLRTDLDKVIVNFSSFKTYVTESFQKVFDEMNSLSNIIMKKDCSKDNRSERCQGRGGPMSHDNVEHESVDRHDDEKSIDQTELPVDKHGVEQKVGQSESHVEKHDDEQSVGQTKLHGSEGHTDDVHGATNDGNEGFEGGVDP